MSILDRVIVEDLSKQVRLFLYDMICLTEDTTEDDIKDYLNYEANADTERQRLMIETMAACKKFKAKCILLNRQLPPTHLVDIVIIRVPGRINPIVKLNEIIPTSDIDTPGVSVDTDDDDDTN